jgi:hypothetical protein
MFNKIIDNLSSLFMAFILAECGVQHSIELPALFYIQLPAFCELVDFYCSNVQELGEPGSSRHL